jgi:hypothetical protein
LSLSTLQLQDNTLTASTNSNGTMTVLLKIWLFRALQMDQIIECQINRKPFLAFLFFAEKLKQS